LEETGYRAAKLKRVLVGPISPASSSDIMTVFRAEGLKKVNAGGGDHTENITVHEVPFSRIHSWLKRKAKEGLLIDPKIYAGLYLLAEKRLVARRP
jgi:ADP-ribose pyrophosphatase